MTEPIAGGWITDPPAVTNLNDLLQRLEELEKLVKQNPPTNSEVSATPVDETPPVVYCLKTHDVGQVEFLSLEGVGRWLKEVDHAVGPLMRHTPTSTDYWVAGRAYAYEIGRLYAAGIQHLMEDELEILNRALGVAETPPSKIYCKNLTGKDGTWIPFDDVEELADVINTAQVYGPFRYHWLAMAEGPSPLTIRSTEPEYCYLMRQGSSIEHVETGKACSISPDTLKKLNELTMTALEKEEIEALEVADRDRTWQYVLRVHRIGEDTPIPVPSIQDAVDYLWKRGICGPYELSQGRYPRNANEFFDLRPSGRFRIDKYDLEEMNNFDAVRRQKESKEAEEKEKRVQERYLKAREEERLQREKQEEEEQLRKQQARRHALRWLPEGSRGFDDLGWSLYRQNWKKPETVKEAIERLLELQEISKEEQDLLETPEQSQYMAEGAACRSRLRREAAKNAEVSRPNPIFRHKGDFYQFQTYTGSPNDILVKVTEAFVDVKSEEEEKAPATPPDTLKIFRNDSLYWQWKLVTPDGSVLCVGLSRWKDVDNCRAEAETMSRRFAVKPPIVVDWA